MNAIEIKDLKKIYNNGVEALKGISLHVEEGDFFALLGPNGAGKSTTISIITSLVRKSEGQVYVFENDLDTDYAEAKRNIGLVPQEFNFAVFETVEQIILNQAGFYGVPRKLARERAEHYLHKLGLWKQRHSQARHLSGGMKRRLMIVRALLHEPRLLILDEPTAGVDIELRRGIWEFLQEINQAGVTVILTTHYLEEAEHLCRNIAIIDQGAIVENTSMRGLLETLQVQTYILELKHALQAAPTLEQFTCQLLNPTSLEVCVNSTYMLNELMAELTRHNIHVVSMRTKSTRLEELFLKLTTETSSGT